jgi:hypothetical protein
MDWAAGYATCLSVPGSDRIWPSDVARSLHATRHAGGLMPQSMIVDQFEWRENRLLARLAKQAAVLADRASAAYPLATAAAYAGGLPATSASAMAPGCGSGASGTYPFATAAVDGGVVPTTITLGAAYAGGLPATSTFAMAPGYGSSGASGTYPFATAAVDGGVVPTTITLGAAYAGGLPATTTFTSMTTLVSQALAACTVGAKVLAGEASANLAAGDYMSALAQATSGLLDFQRSVQQLTIGLADIKEARQPLLGEDAEFSTNETTAELEHAASMLQDFYAQIGRNSPQIAILLALLTLVITILAWLYPRSSGGTTIQIEQLIQSGAHVCDSGLPSP